MTMTLEQIIDCLQSRYADKVFVAKDYTKADLILDLQSIASPLMVMKAAVEREREQSAAIRATVEAVRSHIQLTEVLKAYEAQP